MPTPACWNCGYALTGLTVDDVCPECGTPVWSRPVASTSSADASTSQTLGIVGLVLFFTCLGPFASILAVIALVKARAALEDVRVGRADASLASPARVGQICSWITIGFSIFTLLGYIAYAVILFR